MRNFYIYALWRREDELPFYVGRTVDASARIKAHYPKRSGGPKPGEFVILDTCTEADSKELERKWIRDIYKLNPDLKNRNEVERLQVCSIIRKGIVTIHVKDSDNNNRIVGTEKFIISSMGDDPYPVIRLAQGWAKLLGCEQRALLKIVELLHAAQETTP
jgi:predicted metallopeptidase